MTRRAVDQSVRIPRRIVVMAASAAGALVAIAILFVLAGLVRANEPLMVASNPQLAHQQGAVERDIERAYEQAADQVRKVRALNLAIGAAQADQIASKALSDLRTLRHNAFVSLGGVLGLTGQDAESYATSTAQRFENSPVLAAPSPTPVLLAPRFYTIVSRMSALATQLADQATAALTAPAATPSSSPTGTARPTGSPSPSPSR
jgi:hypothetical protein